MLLTLRAVSLHGDPLIQPITARFDVEGGSIGRADQNTMALPDPKRLISRHQAEVKWLGEAFSITNVGSANPIAVGSVTLARGEGAPLVHGDRIRLGGYLLEVEVSAFDGARAAVGAWPPGEADAAAPPPGRIAPPAPPFERIKSPAPAPERITSPALADDALLAPFGIGGEAPLSAANPFAALLRDDPAPAQTQTQTQTRTETPPSMPMPPSISTPAPLSTPAPMSMSTPAPAQPQFQPPAPRPVPPRSHQPTIEPDRPPSPSPPPPVWPRLPDDFDPFASPPVAPFAPFASSAPSKSSKSSTPTLPPPAAYPVDAFADLIPSAESVSIDHAFGLDRGGGGRDFLEDFMASPVPSAPGKGSDSTAPRPLSTDPLLLFGSPGDRPPAAAPAPSPATRSDHAPDWHTAFSPPRPARAPESPSAPLTPTRAPPPTPAPTATATPAPQHRPAEGEVSPAAWAAFCAGAGVVIDRQDGADTEAMRQIGVLLRASVDGILRLMAVRASAKHELHATVTVIQSQRNNPLKFSPDANAALEQLLQPPVRGFLPGPAAVEDAMDDLVGHAIGSLAGTRAALEGVLDRFAPRQLEAKLAGRSMLDSVLPMNRRSRLWELYLQHFETIRSEAQDDFHSLFGRAFLAAYEQQLEGLRGSGGDGVASAAQRDGG